MSKHDHPAAASASASARQTTHRATRHDGWSLDKQGAFLRQLSATHSVTEAAQSVGMSRQSAYRLRSRLKGRAFDLAWEVAFHHSYDVLAQAALERALNGVEIPVFFQGEQVGSYRKFDERLTVALLRKVSLGGIPLMGKLAPMAERHARDFETLLGAVERGEGVSTGARTPADRSEIAMLRAQTTADPDYEPLDLCPSAMSNDELLQHLQELDADLQK
ncbi:hypothetical protein [Pseudoblastomonas halimionae]|uniref:Helix-turn-helix domain-containing protein n=1 Tax=Alteriqipengyuania halimionae TaxID=1926630 RepID=A0A6I4TY71_9SPHN|nr:hypothetical protein [Alteriqipengyuania halimionae]MXP08568.1 hypothetical protein [Alteriqipengyuania halimionae]